MSREHIVFLSKEEITALANLCRVSLKMGEDGASYFQKLAEPSNSALKKLLAKKAEIETDRK